MDEVILARHGESAFSAKGLGNGDPRFDVPLTEAGRREGLALGRSIAGEPIDLCVTTEFARTRETADLALAGRAADVARLVLPDLNDITLGQFEGRPIDEYRAWLREHGPEAPVPGGGESRVDVVARYARGFRTVLARAEPLVLAVIHGLPVAYALMATRGEALPLTLAGGNVAYATPYRLSRDELTQAVEGFDAFVRDPSAWIDPAPGDAERQPAR
jgi:broad specificity phosphatase PhoE